MIGLDMAASKLRISNLSIVVNHYLVKNGHSQGYMHPHGHSIAMMQTNVDK